jgi:hypothetical protein
MELNTAINLIKTQHLITDTQQVWADLGAGDGLFTQALARYLQPGSTIMAVDKNTGNLRKIKQTGQVIIQTKVADFTSEEFSPQGLSGILMANALHYVKEQAAFIGQMKPSFSGKPSWLIIEYDTIKPNPWVPYPINFVSLKELFNKAGYTSVEKINETPSAYGPHNMYAAWIQ